MKFKIGETVEMDGLKCKIIKVHEGSDLPYNMRLLKDGTSWRVAEHRIKSLKKRRKKQYLGYQPDDYKKQSKPPKNTKLQEDKNESKLENFGNGF